MSKKEFPKHKTSILKGVGPSLVAIGLGIGSGEFILWPFLSAKYGYGILWLAVVGISFQVFLNIEIQRYAAVSGSSAVSGFLRISRLFSFWLLFSTLAGFGWPGFASGSAYLLANAFGMPSNIAEFLPYALLLLVVGILVIGNNSYFRIEKFFKYVLPLSFLYIIFLFIYYFDLGAFMNLLKGLVGQGNGYDFIPKGVDLAILLGAFAYAGSGGNLLLGQGYYVLAKKHGMAEYEEGHEASETKTSLHHFSGLRRFIVLENILVFGLIGLLTILALSYLGPVLLGNSSGLASNFGFLVSQANSIEQSLGNLGGMLFLLTGAIALFSVQLGVLDTLGRIATDIMGKSSKAWYKRSIILQGAFGIAIFTLGLREPLWLITIGAVCNALAMAVISMAVLWMNSTQLPPAYRPKRWEQVLLAIIGLVYTFFFIITVVDRFAF